MKRFNLILGLSVFALTVNAQSILKNKIKFKLAEQEVVRSLTFATNSKRLVVGGDKGTLSVYEVTNQDIWNLPSMPGKVSSLAFSFDNRYLASASEDGSFSIYDFQESKSLNLN
ncbi:MAG: hypothetical protein JST14_18095, partial [Bacteroidetes bacterium]|nr:hypothetical protein [Bacteroidota bacterium]